MTSTISIRVEGKVQGVFFRQSTREKALELGICGQVMNRPDGSVYIIATGTRAQLDSLAEWCRQGPPRANVTALHTKTLPLQNFNTFSIQRN